jgi:hypothetical protein
MGVEHRFDASVRDQYVELLRQGRRRHEAARLVGVTPRTVSRRRKDDPAFDEECILAEQEATEKVEDVLYASALNGEPWAVQMVLKARDRDRWGERKSVDVAVSGTVVVEVESGERLERIRALEAELRRRALQAADDGDIVDAVLVEEGAPAALPPAPVDR